MRINAGEAFVDWADAYPDSAEENSWEMTRLEKIADECSANLQRDLEYAFQAGWHSALRNLTTSDI